jgi:hypothetical protein
VPVLAKPINLPDLEALIAEGLGHGTSAAG